MAHVGQEGALGAVGRFRRMPRFPFGLGPLALGQVQHERDAVVLGLLEQGDAHENREAGAILAEVFLFERLGATGLFEFLDGARIDLAVFRRRDLRPPQRPGFHLVPRIPQHAQEGVVGVGDVALHITEQHPDDVGVDQAPDAGMAVAHIGIQPGIVERDGGLGRQQLQHLDPLGREGMGGQAVFQVQDADQG